MGTLDNNQTKPTIESVQQHFAEWRRTKRSRERIPAELWREAALLVGEHSMHQVVRALRVNFNDLKRRLNPRGPRREISAVKPIERFVEIGLTPAVLNGSGEYTVELEEASGRKLKIQLKGMLDVQGLMRAFWGQTG